ncbi:hypothetical protein DOY81_007378 [Sarcophaga bullata]|nr:hypothetical protein DOY81_007378 [Sarcophaga bullata]
MPKIVYYTHYISIYTYMVIINCSRGAIIPDKTSNSFATYLDSIKSPDIQSKDFIDHNALYDAELILNAFALIKQHKHNIFLTSDNEPCKWMGNTVCSNKYEPICVTDFKCVFEVKNQCILDQINCGCVSHHVVPSVYCKNFTQPLFKRCNITISIE